MKYTFERTLSHNMASPAQQFFGNIVGATEYMNGQAPEITGIVASGDTLTIQLIQPQADFLTFLAMPFTCAVPIGSRPSSNWGRFPRPAPTTSRTTPNQHIDREPESQLPRPATATLRRARVRLQPERGDGLPTGPVRRAGRRPDSGRACPRGGRSVRPGQPRRGARASAVLRGAASTASVTCR